LGGQLKHTHAPSELITMEIYRTHNDTISYKILGAPICVWRVKVTAKKVSSDARGQSEKKVSVHHTTHHPQKVWVLIITHDS